MGLGSPLRRTHLNLTGRLALGPPTAHVQLPPHMILIQFHSPSRLLVKVRDPVIMDETNMC